MVLPNTRMIMNNSDYHANLSINDQPESETTHQNSTRPLIYSIIFTLIAFLAFAGNGMFCAVIIGHRQRLLKSPYQLLIFTLAVTDMLTGVFMVATPGYVIDLNSYPVPQGFAGEMFCRIINTHFFVFTFGKVSVLTIVALALERWYSVIKPISYKMNFSRKRIYRYIAVIWLLSALTNVEKLIYGRLDKMTSRCLWSETPFPKEIFIPAHTVATFYIPTVIIWLSFFHVARVLRNSLAGQNERFRSTRKKLTRMCALVSFLLTFCWLPNQIFYTLFAFGITTVRTPLSYFTIVFAMFNSCINPWLCCFTNGDYKKAMTRYLLCFSHLKRQREENTIAISERLKDTGSIITLVGFRYLNSGFTSENEGEMQTGSTIHSQ
ncbi:allatostatin-A receptor-like [Montipora capricornis]|uniref:allatostatin-A receptor-like n=1 Tax=Montipora capricornis TaxID=246305 RepID=UPI0035F1E2A7